MPSKEAREDAGQTRTDARHGQGSRRTSEAELPLSADAPLLQAAAQPESFSTRVFAQRWSVVAGVCLLVAAALLLLGRMDGAFVVATLGVLAWFWNERNRLQPRGIEANERFRNEEEEFEDRDEE